MLRLIYGSSILYFVELNIEFSSLFTNYMKKECLEKLYIPKENIITRMWIQPGDIMNRGMH